MSQQKEIKTRICKSCNKEFQVLQFNRASKTCSIECSKNNEHKHVKERAQRIRQNYEALVQQLDAFNSDVEKFKRALSDARFQKINEMLRDCSSVLRGNDGSR